MKKLLGLGIAIVIVIIIIAGYFFFIKKENPKPEIKEIACTDYDIDKCPDNCVVCPPCEACSSLVCKSEEFCKTIGFDKNWYKDMKEKTEQCKCPKGYRKEGEVCNPECYYSTPKCLAPSIPCNYGAEDIKCGIENCHGLGITCGPNIPEACTMIYQLGDQCRRYNVCGVVNGKCEKLENTGFDACKSCVEKCISDSSDASKQFECESNCNNL